MHLYQSETIRIATNQTTILNHAHQILAAGKELSSLEQNGVLHSF